MKIVADTLEEYLEKIPEEQKAPFLMLRKIMLKNLPQGFEERMIYGMLGYVIPHSIYPAGYHSTPKQPLPFINIASQKNYIALHHLGLYALNDLLEWFQKEYSKHSKYKLDMGKGCVRFKKLDDIPYDLITELAQKITVKEWIEQYEKVIKR